MPGNMPFAVSPSLDPTPLPTFLWLQGTPVDFDAAFQHFKAAANQGSASAQYGLGYMCVQGGITLAGGHSCRTASQLVRGLTLAGGNSAGGG